MNEELKDNDYFSTEYHNKTEKSVYSDRILTVPNILTLARLIALPFLIWFLSKIDRFGFLPPIFIGSFMLLADVLDGVLAKALKQISLVGAILDPIVDKLSLITIAVYLALTGWIPLWAAAIILIRDLGILVFGLRIFLNYGTLVTPVFLARVTPLFWTATFAIAIMEYHTIKWILIIFSSALTLASAYIYYKRYEELIKKKKQRE